ncbi:hypothetical protein A5737_03720 [Mycobacterium colombiense]|nr:hypothetical protein A5737_03720 [Mycobacterium colombiense]
MSTGVCYDLNPGTDLLTDGWHGDNLYAQIAAKDCAEAAAPVTTRCIKSSKHSGPKSIPANRCCGGANATG